MNQPTQQPSPQEVKSTCGYSLYQPNPCERPATIRLPAPGGHVYFCDFHAGFVIGWSIERLDWKDKQA
jgi:hypothetical protein